MDVSAVLIECLADNRGPDPADPMRRQRPNYGVKAELAGHLLTIELTFLNGSVYCCYEPGCHVPLYKGKRWNGLRDKFAAFGVVAPACIHLQLIGIVEAGAIFFDFSRPDSSRRGWYAFKPGNAARYEHEAIEAALE